MKGVIQNDTGTWKKRFAFIEVEGRRKAVFVHIDECDFNSFEKGMEVEFDMGKNKGRDCAVNCKAVNHVNPVNSEFINPYNFVRVEEPKECDRTEYRVDHASFHNNFNTGKLRCKIKAISPMFIPDMTTKAECKDVKDHYKYKFFKINSEPAIPGTSIKGMLRSVYETITNSCFSQISKEDEKINFREPVTRGISPKYPGIILKLPINNELGIILKCDLPPVWVDKYFTNTSATHDIGTEVLDAENIDSEYKNGDLVNFEKGTELEYQKGSNAFSMRHGTSVKKNGACSNYGYLKITGKNTKSKKHSERIFHHPCFDTLPKNLPDNSKKLSNMLGEFEELNKKKPDNEKFLYYFSPKDKHRFDSIQRTQLKTGKAILYEQGVNLEKMTLYYNKGMSVGDLVYFDICDSTKKTTKNLSYVCIPKSTFNKNVYNTLENFSKHLLPCRNIHKLCPACKLFGAVDLQSADTDDTVSLAGKIKITNALLSDGSRYDTETAPLKILGSPHETATSFYLINENYDNTEAIVKRTGAGYDQNPQPVLRGRKYYWHQCDENTLLKKSAYEAQENPKCNNQNATVELLKKNAEFEFDLYFENLAKEELALLIWSLELENGMLHKLGHGKPLGLGSIKINIDYKNSYLVDIKTRYLDINSGGKTSLKDVKLTSVIEPENGNYRLKFKNNGTEIAAFKIKNSKNYEDLAMILEPHPELFDKIKYPASQGKGFQWFVDNKSQQLWTIAETITDHKTQNGFS